AGRVGTAQPVGENAGDDIGAAAGRKPDDDVRGFFEDLRTCAERPEGRADAGRKRLTPSQHGGARHARTRCCFSAAPISSRMTGSSMVAGMLHGCSSAIFFMVPRRILPERVFGSRATVMASLNAATGPILSRTSFTISCSISFGGRVTPALSTMKPHGTSPLSW